MAGTVGTAGEGCRAAAGGDRTLGPVVAARPGRAIFAAMRGGLMLDILTFEDVDEERGLGVDGRWRGLSGESDSCMSNVSSESGVVA